MIKESIGELRILLQGPILHKENWASKNVGRRVSIYITRLLLETNVTPNQITLMNIFVGLGGALLLSPGNYLYSIIGALLLQLYYILDRVDGEVARYRKMLSAGGEYLDIIGYCIVCPSYFFCLALGVYINIPEINVIACGFIAALSTVVYRFGHLEFLHLVDHAQRAREQDTTKIPKAALDVASSMERTRNHYAYHVLKYVRPLKNNMFFILDLLTDSYSMIFLVLLGVIFDISIFILVLYGSILPLRAIRLFYYQYQEIKEREAPS